MSKVKIGFHGLVPAEQVEKARTIVSRMTGNTNFTTPVPSLTIIDARANALEQAIIAAADGGHNLVALRKLRQKELLTDITQLGAYVQTASSGDEEKIRSSGFGVVGDRQPVGILPAPANVRIRYNKAQQMVLVWGGVRKRSGYFIESCVGDPAVETNWHRVHETGKSRWVVTGITAGTRVWLRVFTLSTEGLSNASEPVEGVPLVSA